MEAGGSGLRAQSQDKKDGSGGKGEEEAGVGDLIKWEQVAEG